MQSTIHHQQYQVSNQSNRGPFHHNPETNQLVNKNQNQPGSHTIYKITNRSFTI